MPACREESRPATIARVFSRLNTTVVPLDARRVSAAAGSLARAFHDDPLQSYTLPDPVERAARSPGHFAPLLEYGLRFGRVLTTEGEPRGAAIFLPPGETVVTEERAAAAGLDRLPAVLGADAAERFFAVLEAVDPFHKTDVPPEHWYVFVLGVEPSAQGHGLGRALLTPVIEEARRDGLPCYLETSAPKNVDFYRHLGFRVLRDIDDQRSGLRLWTLRLDPM